jgi:hypothetical protein
MFLRVAVAALAVLASLGAQTKTRNVVLVTADGLRWQELFSGIDPLLMNEKAAAMSNAERLRQQLLKGSEEANRAALMPFVWNELAVKGVILGNVRKNSSVRVTNAFRVSYPGYSEILTGRAQDDVVRGNDKIQNPTPTVLEYVREKLGISRNKVALFGSWDVFPFIGESRPGSVFINAGYEDATGSPRMLELSRLQHDAPTPWDSVRHDYVTLGMALDYMRRERPRLIHIALGETDDWAHDRRYDRVLAMVRYFDAALREVWQFIQSTPEYRDRTTLIVTTDHGRGSALDTWNGHGAKIPGAEQIWIAAMGPDTPASGEAKDAPSAFQRDVTPTILALLGLDYREYQGVAGQPLSLIVRPK